MEVSRLVKYLGETGGGTWGWKMDRERDSVRERELTVMDLRRIQDLTACVASCQHCARVDTCPAGCLDCARIDTCPAGCRDCAGDGMRVCLPILC